MASGAVSHPGVRPPEACAASEDVPRRDLRQHQRGQGLRLSLPLLLHGALHRPHPRRAARAPRPLGAVGLWGHHLRHLPLSVAQPDVLYLRGDLLGHRRGVLGGDPGRSAGRLRGCSAEGSEACAFGRQPRRKPWLYAWFGEAGGKTGGQENKRSRQISEICAISGHEATSGDRRTPERK